MRVVYFAAPVCPLPKALNSSREVGSVNSVTCGPKEIGGGKATCLYNLTWSGDDVTPCKRTCVNNKYITKFI